MSPAITENLLLVFGLGDVLRKLRNEKGLSLEDLAEATGVDKMTISKVERGTSNPRQSTIDALARGVGLKNASELHAIAANDPSRHTSTGVPVVEAERDEMVDVRRGYVPDAVPVIAEGEATPNGLLWTSTIVREAVIEYIGRPYDVVDPDAYGVLVIGDSMQPTFRKGHRVIVSPNMPVEDGDEVYVQLVDGERLIKIAFKTETGWRLESVNLKYKPKTVLGEDVIAIHPIVWAKRKLPGLRVIDEDTRKRRG